MTTTSSRIKTAARAVLLAATLGTAALSAAPAMAQSGPSSSFSIELGNGQGGMSIQGGDARRMDRDRGGRDRHWDRCLTDREIRRGLSDYGFRDVYIGRDLRRNQVEAFARWGRWDYSMRVDRCSGRVDRVERYRRGNGFGLHFQF